MNVNTGRLITTYISNVKNIEKEDFFQDAIKLYIARGLQGFEAIKCKGFKHIIELAPKQSLLNKYKNGSIIWDEYVLIFRMNMLNEDTIGTLSLVKMRLDEGKDVILCCYEKDYRKCHRFILSNYFAELGYECGEYCG